MVVKTMSVVAKSGRKKVTTDVQIFSAGQTKGLNLS